ncbi:hypothetical protein [Microbacterium sp. NPDC096154]|uniref:hypothetical protein n=1 Tax=Microbacterium sp. NPDC096154 TaxID=3155549 RepID=UPI00331D0471
MSRNATITTALAALAVATLALSGCTATAAPTAAEQTPKASPAAAATASRPTPTATPTPESPKPETCSRMSEVVSYNGGLYRERKQPLRDLGAREFAEGEVTFDEDGTPVTYTVAPGDVEAVIAERLCAYPNLASMNHEHYVYPGLVLWLSPNPDTPWIGLYGPPDAEAGFRQIPYQEAIIAAGVAVDAGDIDTARAIWNDTLSGMFTNQETIDAIQKVVDSGDPDALRQLFS